MTYDELVAEALKTITQVMPWDLVSEIASNSTLILLDVREQKEFDIMHIKNSIHSPRGVLESACEWGYDETIAQIAAARDKDIVVICRSGKRSALAGLSMTNLGFTSVRSLAMGIKGWNDTDGEMVDKNNNKVDPDIADTILNKPVASDKLAPK